MISDSSSEDYGFRIVFAEDDFSPRFSIDCDNKGQKKKSAFEYILDLDKASAKVRLKGEFKSNKLRAGVKEIMLKEFSGKPIYLDGIIFKSGKWNGFEGYVDGQDGENYSNAMQINSWSVK